MKKKCARCKKDKELKEFGRKIITKDNLNEYCKDCANIISKAFHKKKRDSDNEFYNNFL